MLTFKSNPPRPGGRRDFPSTARRSAAAPFPPPPRLRLRVRMRRVSSSDGSDPALDRSEPEANSEKRRGRSRRGTSRSSASANPASRMRRRRFTMSSFGNVLRPSLRRPADRREDEPPRPTGGTSVTAEREDGGRDIPPQSITMEPSAPPEDCKPRLATRPSPTAEEAIYNQHLEKYLMDHFDLFDGCDLACAEEGDDGFDICDDPGEELGLELSMRRMPEMPEDILDLSMLPLLEVAVDDDEISVVSDITYR